jgi:hypothetical protein
MVNPYTGRPAASYYDGVKNKPRYREAMTLRASGKTFADIGRKLGVTRQHARQMVLKAHRMKAVGAL